MRILATDLDGTLLGGDPADRLRLRDVLAAHPEIAVVFATGRGLASVRAVLDDPLVPRPRWVIADVGATVASGADLTMFDHVQARLREGWPGSARVRAALRRFPALTYQKDVDQHARCSFYLDPEELTPEITEVVRALGCRWVYSGSRYFDVLPANASKGNALNALAEHHHWSMECVLVAGDSLNDLSLYDLGAHGVIVGNAEPALPAAVPMGKAAHRPNAPGAAGILQALRDLGWIRRQHPVVIAYHRPPVNWMPNTGWCEPSSPNGILPTLRRVFTDDLDAVWATAAVLDDPRDEVHLPDHDTGLPLSFLTLRRDEWAEYFHRACKDTLWPVLMSQPDRIRFDPRGWAVYRGVNRRFARHIAAQARPGAMVWLHDYNLWLVPRLLRRIRPDLRVGLFHHTPFPPPEILSALPAASEILSSLRSLDWAGFHTETFAEHFRQALGPATHRIAIGVHPLGVDRQSIEDLSRVRAARIRDEEGVRVLSIERLDYAKAPVEKVLAVERLLIERPEFRGVLRFTLVCPPPEPGITAYDDTRRELEAGVERVNREWTVLGRPPIEYLPTALSFTQVVDHYLTADVLWVTPFQDGMNLTAKEYIAVQSAAHRAGVLVLSRHAGSAEELGTAALLTDPRSLDDLVATLTRALTMPIEERRQRMTTLADRLGRRSPAQWARQIITAIQHQPPDLARWTTPADAVVVGGPVIRQRTGAINS